MTSDPSGNASVPHVANALTETLILQEAAKVPSEDYTGGAFRHGPIELAGPGLISVMFTGTAPIACQAWQSSWAD
ncbi:hypothetical protein ACFYYB_27160 [Streptomyces sp. NPDC002886]|uniref:hypothetical protein n=1 Tax=Streptomyces sp. NPDC002886 TaxID=3364667 RepID=UPI003680AD6A